MRKGRGERREVGEAMAGDVAQPPPLSPEPGALVELCACMCLHTHTHKQVCSACFFTMAQTGVNNSTDEFSKSHGDVTGKQEENSQLVLAGCGYLHLTRPGCCQALRR